MSSLPVVPGHLMPWSTAGDGTESLPVPVVFGIENVLPLVGAEMLVFPGIAFGLSGAPAGSLQVHQIKVVRVGPNTDDLVPFPREKRHQRERPCSRK